MNRIVAQVMVAVLVIAAGTSKPADCRNEKDGRRDCMRVEVVRVSE